MISPVRWFCRKANLPSSCRCGVWTAGKCFNGSFTWQYGDQLALKLSRRVKENEAALRALEAEQQGLGSAGKADVEAAAERLQEAVRHAEECRKKLEAAMQLAERFAKIRELQEDRIRRERRRQELLLQEENVLLLEQKLVKADEAEKRLPVLKAWRSAEDSLAEPARCCREPGDLGNRRRA